MIPRRTLLTGTTAAVALMAVPGAQDVKLEWAGEMVISTTDLASVMQWPKPDIMIAGEWFYGELTKWVKT